jgi:hypothetical protein
VDCVWCGDSWEAAGWDGDADGESCGLGRWVDEVSGLLLGSALADASPPEIGNARGGSYTVPANTV